MTKVDYTYPLPAHNLHQRYDAIFAALKKGLNPQLVGLPQSSRSAFLKFIIKYNEKFLNEFIDTEKYKFIEVEAKEIEGFHYIKAIATEILQEVPTIDDPLLILSLLKNYISKTNKRIVFMIYEAEQFAVKNPEVYRFIEDLLKINKHIPQKPGVQTVYITSPKDVNPAISDLTINFCLFDKNEMEYTRKRLEYFRNCKISDEIHSLSKRLSFGHYLLYKLISALELKEIKKLKATKSHPLIDNLLNVIWQGSGDIKLINKFKPLHKIHLLPPVYMAIKESQFKDIIRLTAQEKQLFDFLLGKKEVVNRDEIALVIWGSNWQEKYSDWAIDKLVSKLKKKLVFSKYRVLTTRGRGYQIIKNEN